MGQKRKTQTVSHVVYPNISRFDYGRSHGYWVRFQRLDKTTGIRRTTSKLFSDALFGGPKRALEVAIAWRNRTVKTVPPLLKASSRDIKPPGYSYIKRMPVFNYRDGVRTSYLAYLAFLRIEDRKHLTTRWSIEKWGEEAALLACKKWLKAKKRQLASRLQATETRGKTSARKTARR